MKTKTTITIQVNYFGWAMSKSHLSNIKNGKDELGKKMLELFFGVPFSAIPDGWLENYVKISAPKIYHPVVPNHEILLKKLFDPLLSAKKCFCLGEYLASLELSAHVSEMLTLILWNMTPVSCMNKIIDSKTEKKLFGRTFEDLGQQQRLEILSAFNLITDDQKISFNEIRGKRNKYFHCLSKEIRQLNADALTSFSMINILLKDTLQIGLSKSPLGKVSVHPLLIKYIHSN